MLAEPETQGRNEAGHEFVAAAWEGPAHVLTAARGAADHDPLAGQNGAERNSSW